MHRLLTTLDPLMAQRWHPLDGRKIANSLHVIARTGRRHSDWIKEQENRNDDAEMTDDDGDATTPHWAGKPIRTLIFWVYASRAELNARLDARVDKMIPRGLLEEIRELRAIAAAAAAAAAGESHIDATQGIFQAIGYKEFKPFLDALDEREARGEEHIALLSSAGEKDGGGISVASLPADLQPLFTRGLEAMKAATRQYAKRQVGWMRNKLLPELAARRARGRGGSGEVQVVLLDATRPEAWEENVRGPALRAVDAWLEGRELPGECWEGEACKRELLPFLDGRVGSEDASSSAAAATAPPSSSSSSSLNSNAQILCPICTAASLAAAAEKSEGLVTRSSKDVGEVYYRAADERKHMTSKGHRGALARERKLERLRSGQGLTDESEAARRKREERAALRRGVSGGDEDNGA